MSSQLRSCIGDKVNLPCLQKDVGHVYHEVMVQVTNTFDSSTTPSAIPSAPIPQN
jgi:hypothetical protein